MLAKKKHKTRYLAENFAREFFVQMSPLFYDVKKVLEIGAILWLGCHLKVFKYTYLQIITVENVLRKFAAHLNFYDDDI